jgi:hypothetical protein
MDEAAKQPMVKIDRTALTEMRSSVKRLKEMLRGK